MKNPEMQQELKNAKHLLNNIETHIDTLESENANMKLIIARMVAEHGVRVWTGKLDKEQIELIKTSEIYLDQNNNVVISNLEN